MEGRLKYFNIVVCLLALNSLPAYGQDREPLNLESLPNLRDDTPSRSPSPSPSQRRAETHGADSADRGNSNSGSTSVATPPVVYYSLPPGTQNGAVSLQLPDGTVVDGVLGPEGLLPNSRITFGNQIVVELISEEQGRGSLKSKHATVNNPTKNIKYEGEIDKGEPNGVGTEININTGTKTTGNFKSGKPVGSVKITGNGYSYEGILPTEGERVSGVLELPNAGVTYFGQLLGLPADTNAPRGRMIPDGSGFFFGNTGFYVGEVKQNQITGSGIAYNFKGIEYYNGRWNNGVPNGPGTAVEHHPQLGKVLVSGEYNNGRLLPPFAQIRHGENSSFNASVNNFGNWRTIASPVGNPAGNKVYYLINFNGKPYAITKDSVTQLEIIKMHFDTIDKLDSGISIAKWFKNIFEPLMGKVKPNTVNISPTIPKSMWGAARSGGETRGKQAIIKLANEMALLKSNTSEGQFWAAYSKHLKTKFQEAKSKPQQTISREIVPADTPPPTPAANSSTRALDREEGPGAFRNR